MTDTATAATGIPVKLVEPIKRASGQTIETLTLRKPRAGELRGLKVGDLIGGDIAALLALLPRITEPTLIAEEAANLAAEDVAEIAGAVIGFFLSPAQKAAIAQMSGQAT